MKKTVIKILQRPRLRKPILIGGLPGMGYVGKLAAEHLLEQLHAKKFAEIHSPHFPHHVVIEDGGVLRALRNELFYVRAGGNDIIIWVGDVQPISPEGHYEVVEGVLDEMKTLGVKQVFTLGGYATGKYSKVQRKVIGMGDTRLLEKLDARGVVVERKGGPIIGAAGLLLALGQLRGIPGVCLLGETHGMVVDHRAAQAVLRVLVDVLGLKVDMSNLEQRAKATEQTIDRVRREMELRERKARRREEEEVWYIG
ncbi:MAG: proteasome assembly chaperone family protein [Hadesarchaea archaeon]|nr:proteasome assembly chaperone family protein [Hadesarchaea archaeon]